jgi:hypothetical protein
MQMSGHGSKENASIFRMNRGDREGIKLLSVVAVT